MVHYPDLIAESVLAKFRALPKRFKPRNDGRKEWVPVAGIVLKKDNPINSQSPESQPSCECVALATGMKCHPHTKLEHLQGCGLHDWHAEVLAIRAFNRFLVDECADLAAGSLGRGSLWLKWRSSTVGGNGGDAEKTTQQPFKLQDDVSIHMFVSEAPCGDASMELTMAKQEDPTPWASFPELMDGNPERSEDASSHVSRPEKFTGGMYGRGHFDRLGKVRRKPSRPDAPSTLSKSCSDKLALKQCTGLLSALTAQLVWPEDVYLKSLILPESEYVPEACERAFGATGRLFLVAEKSVQERWGKHGFSFKPFQVHTTRREFEYSKRYIIREQRGTSLEPVPSNRSCVCTPRQSEVLINGVLEGRRWFDPHGASITSRRSIWKAALGVAVTLGLPTLSHLRGKGSYGELKASGVFEGREEIKSNVRKLALKGWVRNTGDEEWSLTEEERLEMETQNPRAADVARRC